MLTSTYFPPFLLLRLIRDHHIRNTEQLTHARLRRLGYMSAVPLRVRRALTQFEALGLIQTDEQGNIEPASNLNDFLEAFDVSLTTMSDYGPESLVTKPTFGYPRSMTGSSEVFVLMPFQEGLL